MSNIVYKTISVLFATLFSLLFLSTATSCQKDSDLLLDAVVYNDEAIEIVYLERGGNGPNPNANKTADDDQDGVANDQDDCPFTPIGAKVNAQGCAASQYDTDEDGVVDSIDQCPGTPSNESADASGCSDRQKNKETEEDQSGPADTDNDGVPNDQDDCPYTPAGATVNNFGCSASQYDTDSDGVNDSLDQCPGTLAGESVDAYGCSSYQNDSDSEAAREVEPGFFVTVNGRSSNDGLTESTAWDIEHALKSAQPGDIVYVKAGNYGAVKLTTTRAGTTQNPISFIGYKNVPGDIYETQGPSYSKEQWESNGKNLPANIMPLLDNTAPSNNPPIDHKGFYIRHSNIIIENFMIQDYYDGIFVQGASNVALKNVITARLGNWNPNSNCWNLGDRSDCDNRVGYGLRLSQSDNFLIENCLVIDAGHVGIDIIGSDYGIMSDSEVWSASIGNATDYNITLYNSSHNKLDKIRSYRAKGSVGTSHKGRALAVKCDSDFNEVNGLDAENLRLQIYYGSDDNQLKDITLKGNGEADDSGIQIFGDANRNVLENIDISNGNGIMFLGEGFECVGNGDGPSGSDNYFKNLTLTNVKNGTGQAAISYHRLNSNGTSGGKNYIIGGTIDGAPHLFCTNRPGEIHIEDVSIKNITEGYKTYYPNSQRGWRSYEIKETYQNVTFNNCNFPNPVD
ncbi:right-handed parallel beta-helix repeat-containing protein [Robiginitalea aurantiaca]|uniref:Right-handed parallel beta-helix repeat-containing protein n=1 Tax=Robiginitalea aurantiaca TaxID=3056915 RepID=A0ABT7WIQ8_9FLAO|nr:right-handed parallel beta-helix repeat-containing protein [Robiginitalea aurantiaca]MDM9632802.1 right-handed parallel beta-helix repeat-containing protein [Robiginitalea aurantiaca]